MKKSALGLESREGNGFQCGEEEAGEAEGFSVGWRGGPGPMARAERCGLGQKRKRREAEKPGVRGPSGGTEGRG